MPGLFCSIKLAALAAVGFATFSVFPTLGAGPLRVCRTIQLHLHKGERAVHCISYVPMLSEEPRQHMFVKGSLGCSTCSE